MALADLIQDGWCGAISAAMSFTGARSDGNESTAPGFPSYAEKAIRFAVSESVRLSGRAVVVAEDVFKRKTRSSEDDIAAADRWNLTEELDAPTEEGYAMHETIAAPVTASSDLSIDIEIATLALNEQQRRVIRGVFTDEAMGGIAADLGVTPSRVTRIKTAAFAKMAAVLEEYAPTKSNTEPSTPH